MPSEQMARMMQANYEFTPTPVVAKYWTIQLELPSVPDLLPGSCGQGWGLG